MCLDSCPGSISQTTSIRTNGVKSHALSSHNDEIERKRMSVEAVYVHVLLVRFRLDAVFVYLYISNLSLYSVTGGRLLYVQAMWIMM